MGSYWQVCFSYRRWLQNSNMTMKANRAKKRLIWPSAGSFTGCTLNVRKSLKWWMNRLKSRLPQHKPGAEYRARVTYVSAAEAPSAIADLFAQMQSACPKGWSKDKEWVAAEEEGLTLYYQFTCADL